MRLLFQPFVESDSPDILAPCGTNLVDLIDSDNFWVSGYLPLIWKDSILIWMVLHFMWKKDFFCRGLISRKLCIVLLMFSTSFNFTLSHFLFLYRSPSSLCMVFYSISSNIDEILSINPSANVFFFGDFNVHHKDELNYSGGTDRPGELCYNCSVWNGLTHMVNFPT